MSPFETEKAEADCCHENFPLHKLLSFIKLSELFAITVAIVSSEMAGEREIKK
jgi:hypothetical protein